MYEDDDEFDNLNESNSIIIADLEWAPQPNLFDYSHESFAPDIVKRLQGITEESFCEEVKLWQQHINILPNYNEYEIRKECSAWDINIPKRDDFDFDNLYEAYYKQVQYRNRLTEIISIVFAHHELLSGAQKSLKEMAVRLANGPKHDKDAIATATVQPFTLAAAAAKRCLVYLEAVQKNIEFTAIQLDRLMRERQNLARINQSMANEGMSAYYNNITNQTSKPMGMQRRDIDEIKTRNSRIST